MFKISLLNKFRGNYPNGFCHRRNNYSGNKIQSLLEMLIFWYLIFADCGIFINFAIGNTNLLVQIRYTKTLKASYLYLRASNFSKCIENKQVEWFVIYTLQGVNSLFVSILYSLHRQVISWLSVIYIDSNWLLPSDKT